jgi:tetratricopeptide (TPR) repeat protein
MRLRAAPLLAVLVTLAAAPLAAQLRASRPTRPVQNLPRLMVSNPHSFASADSAAAVRVGAGLREKVETVADKWYLTIARTQMNDALVQYGYPPDAVLPPLVARQLATQLQARAILSSTLSRGEGGRVTVETRLLGISDQTGYMTRVIQGPNQSFEDLGKAIGDSLKPAFTALAEAKECDQLRTTDTRKATEAAQKALKAQPNHGLAEVCLAVIALAQKAPSDQIIAHFQNAVKGDRLSLEAWGGLLGQYQQKNDTAQVIETYKEILRVAPTNQKVREEALKYLVSVGRPAVGEEVAREGLQFDPTNTDILDLLATACLIQGTPEKNKCAIEALEQVHSLDTAKADTLFFQKILFVASQDSTQPAAYVKWAGAASKKYPRNSYFLGELVRAFGYSGNVDSLVASTKRLVAIDSSDMQPVLRAVIALNGAKRFTEAIELGGYVERYGQDTDKKNLGSVLAQGGLAVLQTQPIDSKLAEAIGRKAVSLLGTTGRAAQLANYVLGVGLMLQIQDMDKAVIEAKSCEAIDGLEKIVGETKAAFTIGRDIQPGFIDERLPWLGSYTERITQMRKVYCKK